MRRRLLLLLVSASLAAACAVGGWGAPVRNSGLGGWTKLSLPSGAVLGELLVADEAAALILRGGEIVRVPWSVVESVGVTGHSVSAILRGAPPGPTKLKELQLASRYPFGLTDEQMQRLLDSVGQTSVQELR